MIERKREREKEMERKMKGHTSPHTHTHFLTLSPLSHTHMIGGTLTTFLTRYFVIAFSICRFFVQREKMKSFVSTQPEDSERWRKNPCHKTPWAHD